MAHTADWNLAAPRAAAFAPAQSEPRWVRAPADRRGARASSGCCWCCRCVAVFAYALSEGLRVYAAAIVEPDRAGGDPADLARRRDLRAGQHDLRRLRGVGDRALRLPRQEPADQPDRPALRGLARRRGADLRAALRHAGAARPVAHRARHPHHLRRARHRAGHDLRHLPLRRARADPADAGAGRRGGAGGASRSAPPAGRRSGASPCRTSASACSTGSCW